MIFLAAIFFVKSCLIDVHLFYEYFVRQYFGQATKSIDVFIKKRKFFEYYLQ